jgi:hypothetical protein
MFNTLEPFVVEINSGGVRKAKLRYPTDEEWIKRTDAFAIIRRATGKSGATESDILPLEEFDAKLLGDLQKPYLSENTDEFDEYEASMVLERLDRADVGEVEDSGGLITVPMTVFGDAEVKFVFNQPRRRHAVEHHRASSKLTHMVKRGKQTEEYRISMKPSLKVFAELKSSVEGYAEGSAIPANHIDKAVRAMFNQMGED